MFTDFWCGDVCRVWWWVCSRNVCEVECVHVQGCLPECMCVQTRACAWCSRCVCVCLRVCRCVLACLLWEVCSVWCVHPNPSTLKAKRSLLTKIYYQSYILHIFTKTNQNRRHHLKKRTASNENSIEHNKPNTHATKPDQPTINIKMISKTSTQTK